MSPHETCPLEPRVVQVERNLERMEEANERRDEKIEKQFQELRAFLWKIALIAGLVAAGGGNLSNIMQALTPPAASAATVSVTQ